LRDKTERLARAQAARDRGERFATFLADPEVEKIFTNYERDQLNQMLAAKPTDDDARRACALAINAMRQFKAFLSAAVVSGEAAGETLKRDNTHGR
jgi:hypothetical protein